MQKYPSSSVEQTREQINKGNFLIAQLFLMYLVRYGIREDRRKSLIREYVQEANLSDDEMIYLFTIFDKNHIKGNNLSCDQQRLGVDPSGFYRHEEYLLGMTLQRFYDRRFYRSKDSCYDYVCQEGKKYDLMGLVAPFLFNKNSFEESFFKHLDKTGMDCLVVCTATLDKMYQKDFREMTTDCSCDTSVLIIDEEFLNQ